MLISLAVPCTSCGTFVSASFDTIKRKLVARCASCGQNNGHPVDSSFHIGHALIAHAGSYLSSDANLSILFSGMAIDSYLSHVFLKWRDIEELNVRKNCYDSARVREDLYSELREFRSFASKAKRVVGLTYPKGLSDFIAKDKALAAEIINGFPQVTVSTFIKDIEREVLWKRNDVVHVGKIAYSEIDALHTMNHAKIFIKVFDAMEKWRRLQN